MGIFHKEKMKILSFFISALVAQAPIPNRPTGWVYDPKGNGFVKDPIEVQVFIDLQCPNCLSAWPGLIQMADYYESKVKLSVVDFPLPYHRAAYKIAWGLQVVGNSKNSPKNGAFKFMDLMFSKQDEIHAFATTANDSALVEFLVSELKKDSDFVSFADEFKKGMEDENMDWLARVDWKYGCSLGTSGTPMPYINRVYFDDGIAEYALADWKK